MASWMMMLKLVKSSVSGSTSIADVRHLLYCNYMNRIHNKCVHDIITYIKGKLEPTSSWDYRHDGGELRLPPILALLRSLHFLPSHPIPDVDVANDVMIGCCVGAFNNKSGIEGLR